MTLATSSAHQLAVLAELGGTVKASRGHRIMPGRAKHNEVRAARAASWGRDRGMTDAEIATAMRLPVEDIESWLGRQVGASCGDGGSHPVAVPTTNIGESLLRPREIGFELGSTWRCTSCGRKTVIELDEYEVDADDEDDDDVPSSVGFPSYYDAFHGIALCDSCDPGPEGPLE